MNVEKAARAIMTQYGWGVLKGPKGWYVVFSPPFQDFPMSYEVVEEGQMRKVNIPICYNDPFVAVTETARMVFGHEVVERLTA